MNQTENALLSMLSQEAGTQTLLGSGAVKERIRRARDLEASEPGSCGGTTGGWGNSPEPEPVLGSCGGSTGGWGNSPE